MELSLNFLRGALLVGEVVMVATGHNTSSGSSFIAFEKRGGGEGGKKTTPPRLNSQMYCY